MSEEKPRDEQAEKLAAAEAAKTQAAAGEDAGGKTKAPADPEFNEQELMNLIQHGRDFARLAAAAETPAFASLVNKEISRSGWSRAPLHFAAEFNRPNIVRLLIAKGAAVDQVVAGHTPLTLAAGRNNIECVKILLEHKASINQHPGTAPALWHASLGGSDDLVGLLIENKADVNQSGPRGTALQAACLRADVEVIRRLLAAGAKSDPAVPTAAMLLPWKNVSLLRKLMERGIRASVDLAGKPLERLQTVTLLAKDRTSYLHYMGADALDTFLPFLIASYTPNVGDDESAGANTARASGGDRRAAGGRDKRDRSQDERPQTNTPDPARGTATATAAAPAQTAATPAMPVSIIPNEQVVQACLAMGFSRAQAVDAVLATGNNDTNAAVQHLLAEQAATAQPKAPVAPPPAPKEDTGLLLESLGFAKAEIAAAIAAVGQDAEAATQWILDKQAKAAKAAAMPTSPAPEFKFSIQTDPKAVAPSPLEASFTFAPSPVASASGSAPLFTLASSPAKPVELSNLLPTEAELTSEGSLSRSPSKSPGGARGNAHRRPSKH